MKRKHRIKIKRKADIAFFVCTCGETAFPVPGKKFTFACPIGHSDLLEKRKTVSNNEYPAEIFEGCIAGKTYNALEAVEMVKRAYDVCKQETGDWHNLTKAIADGEPIDWERLERRKVKISHPEEVEIFGWMKSDLDLRRAGKLHMPSAWTLGDSLNGWVNRFLFDALAGSYGWELYIMGEIPMRKQTADELPFGTHFKGGDGVSHTGEYVRGVGGAIQELPAGQVHRASNFLVHEVLGMYGQKESE